MSPPERKKQRIEEYAFTETHSMAADVRSRRSAFLTSLKRDVSPPAGRELLSLREKTGLEMALTGTPRDESPRPSSFTERPRRKVNKSSNHRIVSSPFKLTRIRDLPAPANFDTIGIKDILGDVMLKEVWLFDFLYDVDWVM
jgi:tyrosyl-DNA phosphodiesterase 1